MVEIISVDEKSEVDISSTLKLGIATSSAAVNEGNAPKSLANTKIPEWQFWNIRKRYYITLILFFFSFLDLHVSKHSFEAVRSAALDDWTLMETHYHMDSVGQIMACLCGFLVHRIGGAKFVGVGNTGKAIMALTFTTAVMNDQYPVLIHSFTLGFCRGLGIIGAVDILAHWSPPNERVRLTTFVTLGNSLAFATFDIFQNFKWQTLIHISGVVILSWSMIWICTVSDDPATDRYILEQERNHLCETINYQYRSKRKDAGVPFKRVFSSIPVYALLMEFCISDLIYSLTVIAPYTLIFRADGYDLEDIFLIVAILHGGTLIIRAFGAWIMDYLRCKPNGYGIDKIHKFLLCWGQSCTLVFLFFAEICSGKGSRLMYVLLAHIVFGITSNSYSVITIDFAGRYAGFLKSMINLFRITLVHFVHQHLIDNSVSNMYISIIGVSVLTIVGTIVFVIYGSGSLQSWAEVPEEKVTNNTDIATRETNRAGYTHLLEESW